MLGVRIICCYSTTAVYCDYYNGPGECSWHYEPCGTVTAKTCKDQVIGQKFSSLLEGKTCLKGCENDAAFTTKENSFLPAQCLNFIPESSDLDFSNSSIEPFIYMQRSFLGRGWSCSPAGILYSRHVTTCVHEKAVSEATCGRIDSDAGLIIGVSYLNSTLFLALCPLERKTWQEKRHEFLKVSSVSSTGLF